MAETSDKSLNSAGQQQTKLDAANKQILDGMLDELARIRTPQAHALGVDYSQAVMDPDGSTEVRTYPLHKGNSGSGETGESFEV